MIGRGCTARDRVIGAAVELFAEHGVQGTSLRMIAERIGVGKGAVYYQFQSKDEIVLAVLRPVFDEIARVVESAESLPHRQARRQAAIKGVVDLLVRHAQASFPFRRDRYIDQLIALNGEFQTITDRFHTLLLGPNPGYAARVSLTMAITGMYYCATDPLLKDIPTDTLSELLLGYSERCLARY